jgi:hypothetical protein
MSSAIEGVFSLPLMVVVDELVGVWGLDGASVYVSRVPIDCFGGRRFGDK